MSWHPKGREKYFKKQDSKIQRGLKQAVSSFKVGFTAGTGMSLIAGITALVSPFSKGQRLKFIFREIPLFIISGSTGFGAILAIGSFMRSL